MDPYVRFEVTRPSKEADSEKAIRRSSFLAGDSENPIWEQTMTFQIDTSDPGQLLMALYDSSYLYRSTMSETESIDLSTLKVEDHYQRREVRIRVSQLPQFALDSAHIHTITYIHTYIHTYIQTDRQKKSLDMYCFSLD